MLKEVSYKFIPALATLLCACPAQGVNVHVGFNFPIGRPALVRPVYPIYTVPVHPVCVVPAVRPCHSALIHDIKHDFEAVHCLMHSVCADLCTFSRTIKHNWSYWARSYDNAYGMHRRDLEAIQDELPDILFDLRRIHAARVPLCPYQHHDLRRALVNLADIMSSGRRRSSDINDVIMYLSQIQRILVTI